jgi:hypothetical protein
MLVVCSSRGLNLSDPIEDAGTSLYAEIDELLAAIQISRFSGRPIPEICAMGGFTTYDFSRRVAFREICGLGWLRAVRPKLAP